MHHIPQTHASAYNRPNFQSRKLFVSRNAIHWISLKPPLMVREGSPESDSGRA